MAESILYSDTIILPQPKYMVLGKNNLVAPQPYSIKYNNATDSYNSAANAFGAYTPGTIRFRFRVEKVPSTAFKWIGGFSAAGGGWLICTEDTIGGSLTAQLVCYIGVDGTLKRLARKFILSEMIGQILTCHIVFDSVGGKAHFYIDGNEIGDGTVNTGLGLAYAVYNPSAAALGLGSRAADGAYTSEQSIVEVAFSSSIFTTPQVVADANTAIGTPITGETNRWTCDSSVGANWVANTGAVNLTRNNTPTLQNPISYLLCTKGTFNIFGDSVAAGREISGLSGNGWKKPVQQNCDLNQKGISWIGAGPATAATLDFDIWQNAVGGLALSTQLATLATDLTNCGGPETGVILAFGLNDFIALNHTEAQFVADLNTAIGICNAVRNKPKILIVSCYDVATGSATVPQHNTIISYDNNFDSMINTLKLTYPQNRIEGANYSKVITNPDDPLQLYDGTHPTQTYYDINHLAGPISSAMQRLLG